MSPIFGIIYLLLFFSYLLVALFIIFHIVRYSLRPSVALFGVALFSITFAILLFTNVSLFLSLPFDLLFAQSTF